MTLWTAPEVKKLRELSLDPQRNSLKKLAGLIEHFRNNGSVWSVTEGHAEPHVSKGLARKIRDLTRNGELDWVLRRREETPPIGESMAQHEQRVQKLAFSRESLMAGTEADVPPAVALEIPLVVDEGEAITHIQVSVRKGGTEKYIDCEVLNEDGRQVLEWRRIRNRAARQYLPKGQYILRLGNEFQAAAAKIVAVRIRWEPYTGGESPPPMEIANLGVEYEVVTENQQAGKPYESPPGSEQLPLQGEAC